MSIADLKNLLVIIQDNNDLTMNLAFLITIKEQLKPFIKEDEFQQLEAKVREVKSNDDVKNIVQDINRLIGSFL